MADDVLKLFSKFGANGIILVMVWASYAALVVVGKLPASADSPVLVYKTFLQYALSSLVIIVVSMFVTWNFFGWPKRLGDSSSD